MEGKYCRENVVGDCEGDVGGECLRENVGEEMLWENVGGEML